MFNSTLRKAGIILIALALAAGFVSSGISGCADSQRPPASSR